MPLDEASAASAAVGRGGGRSTNRRPPPELLREKCSRIFIDNEFLAAASSASAAAGSKFFRTIDPSTGDVLCDEVALADDRDVGAAVEAAYNAFRRSRRGSGSRARSSCDGDGDDLHQRYGDAAYRGQLLSKLADLVERDADLLASIEAADVGKPLRMARLADVDSAIAVLRAHAGFCFAGHGLGGSERPLRESTGVELCYTRKEPIGVVAAVLPFNFPLCGAVAKLAPAVAAGCAVVLKPSERCPHSPLYLCSLVAEAGFPSGVVNAVPGDAATGRALVSHPLVAKISFTGSTAVGKSICRAAASQDGERLARVTLELGGKNPCVVCPDADVEFAAKIACGGNFFNSGQICVGISRVLVPDGMYEDFLERVKLRAEARVIGDAFQDGIDQGPLVDERQLECVLEYIRNGIEQGARLVTGGKRHGDVGYFVQPTVLADVSDDNVVAREEIFGPVMCCQRYSTVDEAVRRANDATPFGLAAVVLSKDLGTAMSVAHHLEAGTVWVNTHGVFDPIAPYQGRKQSGLGCEYGVEGLDAYLDTKTVMVSLAAT